jgi:hypothetical protein
VDTDPSAGPDIPETPDVPSAADTPDELHETARQEYLRRQYDVYTAAKATIARHHLRDVRRLALRGLYTYDDVRRARREYRQAKADAPTVWQWAPRRDTLKAA